MTNYKRRKPRKQGKIYRGGIDGPNCSYCGSNWTYAKLKKKRLIQWEELLDPMQ
jgi:hypothetical protein